MTEPEPWDVEGLVAMHGEYPQSEGCETGNDEPHLADAGPADGCLIEWLAKPDTSNCLSHG